jgi:hypothetical protein
VSAASLESALHALGLRCTVEAIDRLAVIIPEHADAGADIVRLRREALALMRPHGFTNLALELPGEPADRAPLHRD